MPTPRLARTLAGAALLLALSGCSLLPQATPAPDDASASADGTPSTAFTLQVQAPAPLQELLEHNLELRRYTQLADLQPKLEQKHKINKLRKLLEDLAEDYDRIYLDTPPALNFYTVSALIAADRVLIPFDCDSFSRNALYGLLQEIEELKEDHNEDLEVEGIVVNQFQPRATLPQQLLDELIAEGLPVLPVNLMSSVKMRESHQACTPLIHLDRSHKLTQQFIELHNLLES